MTVLDTHGDVIAEHVDPAWDGWLRDLPRAAARVLLTGAVRAAEAGEHRIDLGSVGTYRFDVDGELVARSTVFANENVILNSSANSPAGVGTTITVTEPRDIPFVVDLTVIDAGGYGRFVRADIRHLPPGEDIDAEIAQAVAAAAAAELTVVIVGTNAEVESEGWDRHSLALPGRQDELVERVLDVSPDAIVIVNAGAPVVLPWLDRARTVLWAWFPGQECGHAIGDVLTGATEASGRLPWTLPASEADVPVPHALPNAEMRVEYGEGVHVGYRAWERSGAVPAAPFGHGLGWTTWEYQACSLTGRPDAGLAFSVDVANTGSRRGSEVVQAYLSSTAPLPDGVDRPVRWLAGFARVTADAGETVQAHITVPRRALEVWNGGWELPAGDYRIDFGRSIRDLRLSLNLTLPPNGEGIDSSGEVTAVRV